jgi:phenylalanyl-tRNA synthetase beta chain
VSFFDIYRGKPVPAGRKSVAFRMVFRAADRTLSGDEVEAARLKVVEALAREFGAELRA